VQISRFIILAKAISLILLAPLCVIAQEKSRTTSIPRAGDVAGLIDIGAGRNMFLECRGSGSPTVILESGYRNDADIWSAELEPGMNTVFPAVARFTRVCAFYHPISSFLA
jgi:hypothetical protein